MAHRCERRHGGPTTTDQRTAYAEFAQQCAVRYHGTVDCWEIWNESNINAFWVNPDPDQYVALLRLAFEKIKGAVPSAAVVTGGLGGATRTGDISQSDFADAILARGAVGAFDAFSDHPYTNNNDASIDGELVYQTTMRQKLDAVGLSANQLWGTETGAPTGGPVGEPRHLGDDQWTAEHNQAQLWINSYNFWDTIPNTGPLLWYTTLRDYQPQTNTTDPADHFGIWRSDGNGKQIITTLSAL